MKGERTNVTMRAGKHHWFRSQPLIESEDIVVETPKQLEQLQLLAAIPCAQILPHMSHRFPVDVDAQIHHENWSLHISRGHPDGGLHDQEEEAQGLKMEMR